MNPNEFLKVARELSRGTTEAHWRTCIGRCYYTLLLAGRELLLRWGLVRPPRNQVHAFVKLRFIYSKDQGLTNTGRILEALGDLRNQADYELGYFRAFSSPIQAAEAVRDAEDGLLELTQVDADPSRRAAAIAGIRAAFP